MTIKIIEKSILKSRTLGAKDKQKRKGRPVGMPQDVWEGINGFRGLKQITDEESLMKQYKKQVKSAANFNKYIEGKLANPSKDTKKYVEASAKPALEKKLTSIKKLADRLGIPFSIADVIGSK